MKSKDFYSSFFWMVLGIGISYGGYNMGLGIASSPGSGYIFFGAGIIMVGLSLAVLFQALRIQPKLEEMRSLLASMRWPRILSVILALCIYGYVFQYLGFILSSFFLLVFLFKAFERQKWSVAILGAILASLIAYLIFQVCLGATFPMGLLEGLGNKIWSY